MEGFRSLIAWLAVTDLEHLDHNQGKTLVKEALDAVRSQFDEPEMTGSQAAEELPADREEFDEDYEDDFGDDFEEEYLEDEDDPLLDALERLESLYEYFLEGGLPAAELQEFFQLYQHSFVEEKVPVGEQLEMELRQMAEDLTEEEWCTGSYLKLENGVQAYLEGDPEPLNQAVEEMEIVLDQAWSPYAESPVADHEITAESVLGHQLLAEGVQEWIQAIDFVREIADGADADWQEALDTAQYANRLLIVVERFSQRLQKQG